MDRGGGVYSATINRVSARVSTPHSSVNVSNLPLASPANSQFSVSTLLENMSIGDTSANVTDGLRFLADTTNSNSNAYVVESTLGKPRQIAAGQVDGRHGEGLSRFGAGQPTADRQLLQERSLRVASVRFSITRRACWTSRVQVTDMNHPTDLADYGLPLTDITHTGVNGEYGSTPPTGHNFGYYF